MDVPYEARQESLLVIVLLHAHLARDFRADAHAAYNQRLKSVLLLFDTFEDATL